MHLEIVIYITVFVGLLWGRFKFFKTDQKSSLLVSILYDPIVLIHFVISVSLLAQTPYRSLYPLAAYYVSITLGAGLYAWAVKSSNNLSIAWKASASRIITTGAFGYTRHPFYAAYILIWSSTAILFNSPFLWITLSYLVVFYVLQAFKEEKQIKATDYSREYQAYAQSVGMFLPRIKKWKS